MMSVPHEAAPRFGATTGLNRADLAESPPAGERRPGRLTGSDPPALLPAANDQQLLEALRDGQRLMPSLGESDVESVANCVLEHCSGRLPACAGPGGPGRTDAAAPGGGHLFIGQSRTAHEVIDIELFDPCDASRESPRWRLHIDGSVRASRTVDDTLVLVTRYRPHVAGLDRPATTAQREANERLISKTCLEDLLPCYRKDAGARQPLVTARDWLVDGFRARHESCTELVVIVAIRLATGCITDVRCLSGLINGLHLSDDSVHVGTVVHTSECAQATLLHRFELDRGRIRYRASGVVPGEPVWGERECFMDEYRDQLRVITTERTVDDLTIHRLSVLSETADGRLVLFATVPDAQQPAPFAYSPGRSCGHSLGNSKGTVRAVHFAGERIYVVTSGGRDDLHLIDHGNPADPQIASSLELPAAATDLRTLGPPEAQLLLAIGARLQADVNVVLLDVCDMSAPRRVSWDAVAASCRAEVSDRIAPAYLAGDGARRGRRFSLPMTSR